MSSRRMDVRSVMRESDEETTSMMESNDLRRPDTTVRESLHAAGPQTGSLTMVSQKSSMEDTMPTNCSRSTGLLM